MDHADIHAAVGERRETDTLQRHDPPGAGHRHLPGRVEALDVPDGDRPAAAPGRGHDLSRLLDGGRDRLLDEEVDACFEERQRDSRMPTGRRGDDGRLDQADELLRLGKRPAAMLAGNLVARCGERIDDGDELDIGPAGEKPGVDRSEMPTTDHRHLRALHAALRRGRARPCRPSCWLDRNWRTVSTSGKSIDCERRISRACAWPTRAR